MASTIAPPPPSSPGPSRASTSSLLTPRKDVDGRDTGAFMPAFAGLLPGHDEGGESFSLHHNLCLLGHFEAIVADPAERERAAVGGDRIENHERVRGDRRKELRLEDRLAVVRALERRDDVARDRPAVGAGAKAGLHHVRDQRLDLDHVAAFGLLRHIDEGTGGHGCKSSRHAASVTMTSWVSAQ